MLSRVRPALAEPTAATGPARRTNAYSGVMAQVQVPDLVGLTYTQAVEVGRRLNLDVVGVAPDGRPVPEDSAGVVVEQDPLPESGYMKRGRSITVRVGRPPGGSGDREPLHPLPIQDRDDPDPDEPEIPREPRPELEPVS